MFTYISGLYDEYESYHKFSVLGAHKFAASLDFYSQSYRQNTIARSAENRQNKEIVEDVVVVVGDLDEVIEDVVVVVGGVVKAVGNVVKVSKM
jgi:hypothetical protein